MSTVFMDTLKEIRGGAIVGELGAELQQLVSEVRATGKAGRIVLTLDVKPVKKGGEHTMLIEDDIKVKPPKYEREGTILYATDANELSRKDPRQPELTGLRDVRKPAPAQERQAASNE